MSSAKATCCSRLRRSTTWRRTPSRCTGAASRRKLRPCGVSVQLTPRRSESQELRSTYPTFSRRRTVWVSRERECETCSARVDMRRVWSGASDRRTRISYSCMEMPHPASSSRLRRAVTEVEAARKERQASISISSSRRKPFCSEESLWPQPPAGSRPSSGDPAAPASSWP